MAEKRWLVTGASGFVGSHFLERLERGGDKVFAFVVPKAPPLASKVARLEGDLQHAADIAKAVKHAHPTHVMHLAGMASPAACEILRKQAWAVNVNGTFNLLEALDKYAPSARCLVLSSAFVYKPARKAFAESATLGPGTFYGWTKFAAEQLAQCYAQRGQPVFVARPFNLIGPGQSDLFLAPAVARQIALAESGKGQPLIRVGKLGVERDFLDVRDAVEAFLAILERGKAGQIYNVCSGKALKVSALVDKLVAQAKIPLQVLVEGRRAKRADHPRLVGSAAKIRRECGWKPKISLDRSLADLLAEWRSQGNASVRSSEEARVDTIHSVG